MDGFFTSQRIDADGYLQSQITVQFVQRDKRHTDDLGGLVPWAGPPSSPTVRGTCDTSSPRSLHSADKERMVALQRLRRSRWRTGSHQSNGAQTRVAARRAAQLRSLTFDDEATVMDSAHRTCTISVGFGDCFLLFIPHRRRSQTHHAARLRQAHVEQDGSPISEAAKDVVKTVSRARARHASMWSSPPTTTTTTSADSI